MFSDTLERHERLLRIGKYYYPANPLYSGIKLKRNGKKYVLVDIKDIDNIFVSEYIRYITIA